MIALASALTEPAPRGYALLWIIVVAFLTICVCVVVLAYQRAVHVEHSDHASEHEREEAMAALGRCVERARVECTRQKARS